MTDDITYNDMLIRISLRLHEVPPEEREAAIDRICREKMGDL